MRGAKRTTSKNGRYGLVPICDLSLSSRHCLRTHGVNTRELSPEVSAAAGTENMVDFTPLATQRAGEHKTHSGLIFTNPNRFNRTKLAYPRNLIAPLRESRTDPPIAGESWIWWL